MKIKTTLHYTILKLSLKRTGSNELMSRVKAIFRAAFFMVLVWTKTNIEVYGFIKIT